MTIISFPTTALDHLAWEDISADKIVDGKPLSRATVLYTDDSGQFFSGIYECTSGAWRISYDEDEFCTLIEGHVRLTDDAGISHEYRAPDSFLIPSGFRGIWTALTPIRKFFVIHEKEL